MTSKIFGSIVALVLACATATAADIRRVVTALDANDKAIALFDSRITLEPGSTPSAKLWVTDSAPAGLSFTDDSGAKPTALGPPTGRAIAVAVSFMMPMTSAALSGLFSADGVKMCA